MLLGETYLLFSPFDKNFYEVPSSQEFVDEDTSDENVFKAQLLRNLHSRLTIWRRRDASDGWLHDQCVGVAFPR